MQNQKLDPRQYQSEAIIAIRNEFLKGHRKVLLHLATGGGKTFIFCRMIVEAFNRSKKSVVIVRGRKLVDQASQRLFRESVPHGVLMNGHWNNRPHLPVQVVSVDTAISRSLKPAADLIVVDEAHLATSPGFKKFLSQYPEAYIVAVTATPYVEDSLRHLADTIVKPITMTGLIELGFLVPFRYFAPASPDLSHVSISSSTKDYVVRELEEAVSTKVLTGKIIDHWKNLASDRPTICFAVNINHSKMLVEKFLESGIQAEHCDADTKDDERNEIIKRLESGTTKVVCNVGIFCTGVDIPSLGAIIMARPTKSKNLFIQQAGRGTRTHPSKQDCLLLDHAGNITEHGFPTDEFDVDLDGKKKQTKKRETKTCKECFAVYIGSMCPECGTVPPAAPKTEVGETDELLKEIDGKTDVIELAFIRLKHEARSKGWKPSATYYKLINKFGLERAKPYIPDWFLNHLQLSSNATPFGKSPYIGIKK